MKADRQMICQIYQEFRVVICVSDDACDFQTVQRRDGKFQLFRLPSVSRQNRQNIRYCRRDDLKQGFTIENMSASLT